MEPIKELPSGEKDAVEWLVNTYSDRLLRAAVLILGNQHAAEDAVQECLIDAITHLPDFRGDSSIYTWLYTILLRRCRRSQGVAFWRRNQHLPEHSLERQLHELEQHNSPPETNHVLRKAVASLGYKYREIIVLFYYEELQINEISQLLQIPEGTIKNRLYRARKKLRAILGEEEHSCL